MIGQPLQKINHVCLADDYNKLIDVIKPFQNLKIGAGLNGVISTNGISIAAAPQHANFKFPFKVSPSDSSNLNVQFGRVFEYTLNSGLNELTSDLAFDTTSGLTLNATGITSDAILLAINKITESESTYNRFTIGFESVIDFDEYFTAQVLANFTQDTPGSFNIEQVAGYDFTFTQGNGGGSEATSGTPEREVDLTTDKPYPFQTVPLSSNDGVQVYLGRVYEYKAFEASETVDSTNPFAELSEANATATGTWIALGNPGTEKIVVVARTSIDSSEFYLTYEDAIITGEYVIARIARAYTEGGLVKVEQIHMGDVSWSEHNIAPFSTCLLGTDRVMYMPGKSVIINEKDYTGDITGTTITGISDWYSIGTGDLYLHIAMSTTSNAFGTVSTLELKDNATPASGDVIVIPIFKGTLKRNVQMGAINREVIRTDTSDYQTSTWYNSIIMSAAGNFASNDRTLSLHGFVGNESPDGSLTNSEDNFTHSFAIREADCTAATVELRWVNWSTLMCSIETQLTEDDWTPEDITVDWDTGLTDHFFDWYCSLSGEGGPFWEKGAGPDINYGTGIGDSTGTCVVDLDEKILTGSGGSALDWGLRNLKGNWAAESDLGVVGDLAFGTLKGYLIEFCTTDNLVYFSVPPP